MTYEYKDPLKAGYVKTNITLKTLKVNEMTYEYKDPLKAGYVKTKITLKQLYKIGVRYRGKTYLNKVDVYYNPDIGFKIQYFNRSWVKLLIILLYPLVVLLEGVTNIKEVNREVKRQLFQKKYGAFGIDICFKEDKLYPEFMKLMENTKVNE